MCGRYVIVTKLQIIEKAFDVDISEVYERFIPSVNVSPGEDALVITNHHPKKAQLFTFGFTPKWAKKKMYVINARSEGDHNKENDPNYVGAKGILSKPMFRHAIRSQRCLVLADGFIEGPQKERLNKPYLIYNREKRRPLALAGIWDEWVDKSSGEITSSFAILTTTPNTLIQKIGHHRSPVVLEEENEKKWLDNDIPLHEITALLQPFDPEDFNAYPISKDIKSPRNKDPELLKPIGDPIVKEHDYVLYQELKLEGMGHTTARKRRNDQLGLFDQ